MEIMHCRFQDINKAISGLEKTNVPLVSEYNGQLGIAGYPDDPGIYYFVPMISKYLDIPTETAINLFLYTLIAIGSLVSILCFFYCFQNWISRLTVLGAFLLLARLTASISDVYTTMFFATSSILPIFMVWSQKNENLAVKLHFTTFFSGFLLGYCNFIRSNSGTGVIIFIVLWVLLNKTLKNSRKLIALATLLLGLSLPIIHTHYLEKNRDLFLAKNNVSHKQISITHPIWHSIYIGLGYTKNPYGIRYDDNVAINKVKSINASVGYCTKEYESILKNECLFIAKKSPLFIIKNLLQKLFIVLIKTLKYTYLGCILVFFVKPSLRFLIPIFGAISFYALPGILTIPVDKYLLGMISSLSIFGLYMICTSVKKYENMTVELNSLRMK